MQVVILAAGNGKRMGALTKSVPKPMLKIKGKPLLEHKINALPKEITEVIIVAGYRGEQIMNYFKRFFNNRKITYFFQRNLNGTGGALHLVRSVLGDRFFVMMGDDLYHKRDIKKLMKHNHAILGYPNDHSGLFGALKTNNRNYLVEVVEKPKRSTDKFINTGLYILDEKFFDYDLVQLKDGEFGLPQTVAVMAKDFPVKVEKATLWHPIGTPEDLEKAENIIHKFF